MAAKKEGPMLASLIFTYTAERRAAGMFRPRSAACIQDILWRFVEQVGNRPARGLNRGHMVTWMNERGTHVAPATMRQNMSAIRGWLDWMVERETIKANPMRTLRGPKEPRRLPRVSRPSTSPRSSRTARTLGPG